MLNLLWPSAQSLLVLRAALQAIHTHTHHRILIEVVPPHRQKMAIRFYADAFCTSFSIAPHGHGLDDRRIVVKTVAIRWLKNNLPRAQPFLHTLGMDASRQNGCSSIASPTQVEMSCTMTRSFSICHHTHCKNRARS